MHYDYGQICFMWLPEFADISHDIIVVYVLFTPPVFDSYKNAHVMREQLFMHPESPRDINSDSFLVIKIRWTIRFAVIRLSAIKSPHMFAHARTQLS